MLLGPEKRHYAMVTLPNSIPSTWNGPRLITLSMLFTASILKLSSFKNIPSFKFIFPTPLISIIRLNCSVPPVLLLKEYDVGRTPQELSHQWVEQTFSSTPYSEGIGYFGLFVNFTYTVYIEAKETLIPDFTKSTHQKAKEHTTDAADRVARYVCEEKASSTVCQIHMRITISDWSYVATTSDVQPDSKKSISQAVFDKAQRASHRVRRRLGLGRHL